MKHPDLSCYLHGDLPLWEKRAVHALVDWFSSRTGVQLGELPLGRHIPKNRIGQGAIWIVTRHWRKALAEARRFPRNRVYLSVFNLGSLHPSLPTLFLRKLRPALPPHVHIVTHCPLNYRFFREIEGLGENQVSLMPLPCVGPEVLERPADRPFTVGMLDIFNPEANLNYVMSVAHYLCQHDPKLKFHLIGVGRLWGHLRAMVRDLGLSERVEIMDSAGGEGLAGLDLLIYAPLRNDHFAQVLAAAAAHIPVLATEVLGIDDYIVEGRDGYVLPLHEVRAMGELVLRFSKDQALRKGFADRLGSMLSERFSLQRVGERWESLLSANLSSRLSTTAAA